MRSGEHVPENGSNREAAWSVSEMAPVAAFTGTAVGSGAFAGRAVRVPRVSVCSAPPVIMADKGLFGLPNPFAKKGGSAKGKDSPPPSLFAEPQPGDPGYGKDTKKEVKKVAKKVVDTGPVFALDDDGPGFGQVRKGLDLLKEDLLKNAPERIGVGRQDATYKSAPQYGEPGYKQQAYETVFQRDLGLSPFTDDKNSVGKVGGIEAVKQAAIEAKMGKSAKVIKKESILRRAGRPVFQEDSQTPASELPDYLKPLADEVSRASASTPASSTPSWAKDVTNISAPAGSVPDSLKSSSTTGRGAVADSLPDYLKPIPEDKAKTSWTNY